ncbi:MAG: hypothetical protein MJY79_05965 [Bacteroidaceae bacterium]|nr:hypothetical protein [Bacteroidaceae bacterium]
MSNVQMLTADVQAQVVLPDQIAADFELGFEVSEDMTFPEGTTTRCKVKYYNPDGTYSHSLTGLRDSTTYRVRAYMINQMCFYSSSPITVTTLKFRCVDLGLSVKWATVNVGAARPEEYGDYFAWGETEPKMEYSWATYKYCNGSDDSMTKYCNKSRYGYNGFTDSKTVLDPDDDAAHVNWGGSWRIPTAEEHDELRNTDNCSWVWTTLHGVAGYKVQSKKPGYTDNWIFLPAAGYHYEATQDHVGSIGHYWTSSFYTESPRREYDLSFSPSDVSRLRSYRCDGLSIRPVCP